MELRKRIVTGDRPTGKLHLGHYIGSLKNRVALQERYDCYFLIADLHTLTTKPQKEEIMEMRSHIHDLVLDWLGCGIDPEKSTIYLQSAIPEIFELNLIFAMKITRSTFRELQNVILNCANKDKEMANFLFELLLTGQIKHKISNEKHREMLEEVIKYFTIPARLAKEVHERGEFVNIITSDLLTQGDQFAFLNRIRRIDGEEFVFMSDTQNTLHILNHFVGRLFELDNAPKGKEELLKHKKELQQLVERLKKMA